MSTRLSSLVAGVAMAAGAAGVVMELAGVDSAVRATLVLLFLAVAPTAAIAGLLRTLDGFARLIIACTANLAILALTAIIMLAEGVWSPTGGLLAVAAITAACLAARLPPVRRRVAARAASGRKAGQHLAARAGLRPGRGGTKAWLDWAAARHSESLVPPATVAAPDAPTVEFPAIRDHEPPDTAAAPDAATSEFPAIRDLEPPAAATADALTSEFPVIGDPEVLAATAADELPADDEDDAQPAAGDKDTSKAGRR
jgi:hypothetical protein